MGFDCFSHGSGCPFCTGDGTSCASSNCSKLSLQSSEKYDSFYNKQPRSQPFSQSLSLSFRAKHTHTSPTFRTALTPPIPRRNNYQPTPTSHRENWIQRHRRRQQTVNADQHNSAGNQKKEVLD